MTLRISDHNYNINSFLNMADGNTQVNQTATLTQDALRSIEEAHKLHVGYGFTATKWVKAGLIGVGTTTTTAAAIGAAGYAVYENSTAIVDFVTNNSEMLGKSGLVAAGAAAGQLFTQDGRDMLKFIGKGVLLGVVFAGYKAGQRSLTNSDKEADQRNLSIANKHKYAIQSLHRVYKGMTDHLKSSKITVSQAEKILELMPLIHADYESLGLSPEECRNMTEGFRGALEMHAMMP